jgi:hypothetical protein
MVRPRSPRVDGRLAERLAYTMFALSTPSRVQILGCLLDGPQAGVMRSTTSMWWRCWKRRVAMSSTEASGVASLQTEPASAPG